MGKLIRNSPPRLALRFLEWFCPAALFEGIEGDLVERFEQDLKQPQVSDTSEVSDTSRLRRARRRLTWNVIKFFRPAILFRNKFSHPLINTVMLRSYFKITCRNILKNKGYSFINIFGLALGIACCLLMFNYAKFELSYDNFHPNVGRTYRVDQTMPWGSEEGIIGSTAPPLANVMKVSYPEVEEAMRINTPGDFIVRYADGVNGMKAFNENHVLAADSNFFSFIGFELKEGNPAKALQGLNKVVISEEVSKKLFGEKPALGKILQLGDDRVAIEVTGVTKRQPENSHFHFDYLLSMETFPEVKKRDWSWVWIHMVTYVRLQPDADPVALKEKMKQMAEKVVKPAYQSRGMDYDNAVKGKAAWNFYLQPMRDIHLRSGDNRIGPVGDIRYVITFAVIGIFVLLIAAINFINLSTARATKRAREVGVKKTLGASRGTLVSQFQIESILITFFSTALALILVEALRLIIARSADIEIPLTLWNEPGTILLLPLIPLVIGSLAGLYPSFYLTAFRPAQVLKGKLIMTIGNSVLRNGLVVVQFTISIALIAGTLLVFQQLRFVSTTSLGFDKENVLLIKGAEKLGRKLDAFKHEIENYSGVVQAGIAMEVPGGNTWDDGFSRENSNINLPISLIKTDDAYFKTLNFQLLAGRSFEKERPSDKNAIILNETAVPAIWMDPWRCDWPIPGLSRK